MASIATIRQFFREVQAEAKKVVWPDRKETVQATAVVLVMVLFIAAFLWLVDSVLSSLIKLMY